MYASLLLTVSGLLAITAAAPTAHTDKLFMPGFDDVGRIYSEPNFKGASAHILSATDLNKCVPLVSSETGAPGINIGSIQICVPMDCVFSHGTNCEAQSGDDHVLITHDEGEVVDMSQHLAPGIDSKFLSAKCVPHGPHLSSTGSIETADGDVVIDLISLRSLLL